MFFLKTLKKISEVIHDRALDELYNPQLIQQELQKIQSDLEMGKISEEDYDIKEAQLLQRLQESYKARNPK